MTEKIGKWKENKSVETRLILTLSLFIFMLIQIPQRVEENISPTFLFLLITICEDNLVFVLIINMKIW